MALTTFTAAQVLTAAQLNAVQANDYNQTVSTKTASYTLVAADKGTRVVMNAAGATTITVNDSLFSAGDTLDDSKTLAQALQLLPLALQLCRVPGLWQYRKMVVAHFISLALAYLYFYPSAGPAASSGLTFIASGTQSATATASITNIFTSSYTTYKIVLRNLSSSIINQDIRMRLGSAGSADTGANYNSAGAAFSTNTALAQSASGTSFIGTPNQPVNALSFWTLDLVAPNLADKTYFNAQGSNTANDNYSSVFTGVLDTSTQYTDFFIFLSSGNIGFSYQVFGYGNS
jgi:hypothetical protein